MDLTGRTAGRRIAAALRGVPTALREDLWQVRSEPVPRVGEPGYPVWRPVSLMVLVVFAATAMVVDVHQYHVGYNLGTGLAVLLAGVQAVSVVVALYRPVAAWWAVTAVMFFAARAADGRIIMPTPVPGGPWDPAGHTRPPVPVGSLGPFTGPGPDYPWTSAGIAMQAMVLFLLALRLRPRAAVSALLISSATGLVALAFTAQYNIDFGFAVAVLATATLLGAALRGRRVARKELVVQEEVTAEERARRTLLEERNRIARELHDVVAHHMSVISIQAQVAPHLVENPSDELKENLAGIRQNAVDALTELRRVLGVLRSEDPGAEGAPHAPQPSLDRLDELVDNVRGAGLTVTVDRTGTPRPLSPGVELSAFRIVQEALSNAMRHAPGSTVRVELAHQSAELVVRVANTAPDRPVAPSPGAGHGLLGMRERTAMLGGEMAAGATPDGGYEVTAALPLKGHA
ncbi:sensor histidine kinase [Streptomyces sp. NPDC048696]|uniref:sensor histidine kinase n=1 Tax=Streptomyces sp. NPDC048696 TaxID=3365585 RepID=UPI003715FB1A